MKNFNCLIIGGSGFVGRHLVSNLRVQGHNVFFTSRYQNVDNNCFQLNVRNIDELNKILKHAHLSHCVDKVYYCAGESSISDSMNNPLYGIDDFLIPSIICAEYCLKNNLKFYLISSAAVLNYYTNIYENRQKLLESNYVASRVAAEAYFHVLLQQRDSGFKIFRLYNVYGPSCNRMFVYDAILKINRANAKVTFKGSGRIQRIFTHVEDVASAIIYGSVKSTSASAIDITNDHPICLYDAACTIRDIMGMNELAINFSDDDDVRSGYNLDIIMSMNSIRNLGFNFKYDFVSGVLNTLSTMSSML